MRLRVILCAFAFVCLAHGQASINNGGSGGAGTIAGSTGASDNRIIRADGVGGATIQSSAVTIDDSGNMTGVASITTGASNGGVDLTEGTGAGVTAAAGHAVCYADSTGHGLLCALNGGTFSAVLLTSSEFCSDAGANDTYTCSLTPTPAAYVTGGHYRFKANTKNTGGATINFNSLGAKNIVKVAGGSIQFLRDDEIRAGQWVDLVYDGTNMVMLNPTAIQGIVRPNARRFSLNQYPGGASTSLSTIGDTCSASGTPTTVAASATDPLMAIFASAGTTGSNAGCSGAIDVWVAGRNLSMQTYSGFPASGDWAVANVWIGFTNQTAATMGAGANPAGNWCGFRWIAGTDTNYQFSCKDGTTQSALSDTGIAGASTTKRKFEVYIDDNQGKAYGLIDNVLVGTVTSNLPTSGTTSMRVMTINQTRENVAKNWHVAYVSAEGDK